MLKLAIKLEDDLLEFPIKESRNQIGRSHDVEFRIKHSHVSAFHAEIRRSESGDCEIVDLDSSNGTFVNDQRIDRSPIKEGDQIRFGTLKCRILSAQQSLDTAPAAPVSKEPVVIPLSERMKTGSNKLPSAISSARDGQVKELETKVGALEKENHSLKEKAESAEKAVTLRKEKEAGEKASLEKEIADLKSQLEKSKLAAADIGKQSETKAEKVKAEKASAIGDFEAQVREAKKREELLNSKIEEGDRVNSEKIELLESDLKKAREAVSNEQEKTGKLLDQLKSGEDSGQRALDTLRAELAEARDAGTSSEKRVGELETELRESRAAAREGETTRDREIATQQESIRQLEADLSGARSEAETESAEFEAKLLELEKKAQADGEISAAAISELQSKLAEQLEIAERNEGEQQVFREKAAERERELDSQLKEGEAEAREANAQFEAEKSALEEGMSELKAELSQKGGDFDKVSGDLKTSRSELSEARARIEALEGEIEELKANGRRLDGDLAKRVAEAATLMTSLEVGKASLTGAREEIDALNARIEAFEAESADLASENRDLASVRGELATRRDEVAAAEKSLEEARAEQVRVGSEIEAANRKAAVETEEHGASIQLKKNEIAELEQQVAEATKKAEEHADACDLAQKSRSAAEQSCEEAEQELAARRADLDKVLADLRDSEDRHESVESNVKQLTGERDSLKSQLATLTGELAALTTEIDSNARLQQQLEGAEQRLREIEKREAEVVDHELKLDGQAAEEKELKRRLADLESSIRETERQFEDSRKKLERKLHELKLAEDRIDQGAELIVDIEVHEQRLAELRTENEALIEANRKIEEERVERSGLAEESRTSKGAPRLDLSQEIEPGESKLSELEKRIAEYEEYSRILRDSLRPDKGTVRMMSAQIIRKLDLVQDLISHYNAKGNDRIVDQLTALRDSFHDMLKENSIEVYTFEPGTELNLEHRRKIKIVESRNGGDGNGGSNGKGGSNGNGNGDQSDDTEFRPRVLETVRAGYLFADAESGGKILRKAEIVTQTG